MKKKREIKCRSQNIYIYFLVKMGFMGFCYIIFFLRKFEAWIMKCRMYLQVSGSVLYTLTLFTETEYKIYAVIIYKYE